MEEPLTSNTPEAAVRSIPFGRPWLDDDDRAAVQRVLKSHILTHGPECAEFESEFGDDVQMYFGHGATPGGHEVIDWQRGY